MKIGRRIEERRKALGISQSQLARDAGLSQSTINGLIHGHAHSSTHLHRIARALKTTPAYLACETDDPGRDAPDPDELTPEEAALVTNWRRLSIEDRRALDRVIKSMLA